MPVPDWIDSRRLLEELKGFFDESAGEVSAFGSTVNQVFEAFVFAQVIAWHRENGWTVSLVHPRVASQKAHTSDVQTTMPLRLKFSTRGRPASYTYARCSKSDTVQQIRHGLRVQTRAGARFGINKANIVIDVAVIRDVDLSLYTTDMPVSNEQLITFGEAKHMSAFAELVAGFLGFVAEMQPERLRQRRYAKMKRAGLLPFLFVSGFLNGTGLGIEKTIIKRGFAIEIFTQTSHLARSIGLATTPPPRRRTTRRPRQVWRDTVF